MPPIYAAPTTSKHATRLHSFTAMPPSLTTVLSARRLPAVPAPMGNTNSSISVFTSTGFQALTIREYIQATQALQPDIAIPPADLTHNTTTTPSSKRALRMAERTDEWLVEWFEQQPPSSTSSTFAPVPPVPYPIQWEYLSRLAEDYAPSGRLSGLALYDADVLPDMAAHCAPLLPLPRLSLSAPPTPHHILRQVALGVDVFALPLVNALSDAGLALTFTFPAPTPTPSPSSSKTKQSDSDPDPDSDSAEAQPTSPPDQPGPLPLAVDLSLREHATSLAPLAAGCACHACRAHHRAYVHHLLSAREMLGWTLLQVHNHAVMSAFFAGVRATLAAEEAGSSSSLSSFERERARFARAYEAEFPRGLGERPRARGYQFKSEGGGEARRNKPAWARLAAGGDRDGGKDGDGNAVGREDSRLETPVVPDEGADAKELDRRGFAEIEGDGEGEKKR